ncbi:MAG: polysaccharide biosynthesis protein [Ardenticatenaceae bacterium]|nr:MAG: polysaccharide biosynthesis protein [Ardenticatenaceae bacterium]
MIYITRQITTNTLLKLGAEMGGRGATFLLLLLAAKQLSTAEFGNYNFALALGFVLVQLADFGLQLLLTREVARHGLRAKAQVVAAFHLKLWLSLPVLALLLMLARWQVEIGAIILLLGTTLLLQTFVEFVAYVFRGQQRLGVEVQLLLMVRIGTAVLGALVLWQREKLLWLAFVSLFVMVGAFFYAVWLLRRAGWIDSYAQLWPRGWPITAVSRQLIQQAWPLGVSIVLSIIYTRLAILLLEVMGDSETVAHYSAAWRLVEPTQILPASLLAAVYPAFSLALTQNPRRADRLGQQTSLLLAVAGAVVAFTFWLTGPWLIDLLYGSDFAASARVLQLLGVTVLPVYLNYSLTHYLVARGQQQTLTALTAVSLLLHLLLCWLFIPQFGVIAPAFSVLAAECVLLVGCLWALRQPMIVETAV